MPSLESSVIRLVGYLAVPIIVGAFAVAFYVSVADMGASSALYPKLAIAALLGLVLIEAGMSVSVWRTAARDAVEQITMFGVWRQWRRALYTIALTIAFLTLISILGFYVALVPFMAILLFGLGIRSPVIIGTFSVGILIVSYLLFEAALQVPLPEGIFG